MKTSSSREEREADRAIQKALQALTKAVELSARAGYGTEVLMPLADAQKNVRYAHDVAVGRS